MKPVTESVRTVLTLAGLVALALFAGCTTYGTAARSSGSYLQAKSQPASASPAAAPSRDFDFDI